MSSFETKIIGAKRSWMYASTCSSRLISARTSSSVSSERATAAVNSEGEAERLRDERVEDLAPIDGWEEADLRHLVDLAHGQHLLIDARGHAVDSDGLQLTARGKQENGETNSADRRELHTARFS